MLPPCPLLHPPCNGIMHPRPAAAAHLALAVPALPLQRPHLVRLTPAVLKQLLHVRLAAGVAPRRQRRRLRQKANGQAAAGRWVWQGGRGPQPTARRMAGEQGGACTGGWPAAALQPGRTGCSLAQLISRHVRMVPRGRMSSAGVPNQSLGAGKAGAALHGRQRGRSPKPHCSTWMGIGGAADQAIASTDNADRHTRRPPPALRRWQRWRPRRS